MVIAMLLAHLVGDYVLQWDRLALWKSREAKGVLAHGLIVLAVTWLFSLPFNVRWWPWVLFIGVTHTLIDLTHPWLGRRLPDRAAGHLALTRYLLDQAAHLGVIAAALVFSGYLAVPSLGADLLSALHRNRFGTLILGYAILTMPAWILVEFMVYGLVDGSVPDFSQAGNKYVTILERGLIATFVVLGQFTLVPVVALPRLVFERPLICDRRRAALYVAELLANVSLAVAIGLALRGL